MEITKVILAACLGLCFALPAAAQSIGVLQSAETNNRGIYKIMLAPILSFGQDGADDEYGLAVRGGYGFTDRFDAEAKLGFFENSTFVGADGELWILKSKEEDAGIDFSLAGGVHWMLGKDEHFDTVGLDLTPLMSGHLTEKLELCGALDVSFETIKDAPAGIDDTYTRAHLVPGIEYRVSDTMDFVAEVGLALNDD